MSNQIQYASSHKKCIKSTNTIRKSTAMLQNQRYLLVPALFDLQHCQRWTSLSAFECKNTLPGPSFNMKPEYMHTCTDAERLEIWSNKWSLNGQQQTSGTRPRTPETNRRLLALIAWEYGPSAAGDFSVLTASLTPRVSKNKYFYGSIGFWWKQQNLSCFTRLNFKRYIN